jgi:Flp pilus assembly CpaE family ATPase
VSAGEPRLVALAASGAGWEAAAVRELEAAPDLVLVRRCVDVAELLAVAQTGAVGIAAVDLSVPDLDLEAVRTLGAAGVQVVGLGRRERADALGIEVVGPSSDVAEVVRSVVTSAGPSATVGATDPADAVAPLRRGRIVVVWGPAGAPGRSTLALALADALADGTRRCVLVDADTYGGAQAQQLGLLDEVSGLMAACRAANRGHPEGEVEHLQQVRPGLAVLTGLPRPDMWVHVRPAALERVLDGLRGAHDVVVADVGFCLEPGDGPGGAGRNQATTTILEQADVVVAVGRADPVGLTRLVRGLHDLRGVGVDDPVVVLNQVRPGIAWSRAELAATVERLADVAPRAFLPQDAATLDAAALRGATPREVHAGSPYVAAVAELASNLVGAEVPSGA